MDFQPEESLYKSQERQAQAGVLTLCSVHCDFTVVNYMCVTLLPSAVPTNPAPLMTSSGPKPKNVHGPIPSKPAKRKRYCSPFSPTTTMRRQDVTDEELFALLELVGPHECLYNTSCPSYKDHDRCTEVWKHIAESMKREDGLFWKRKYRNIRDSYVKRKRALIACENEAEVLKILQWKFYRAFSFLPDFDDSFTLSPSSAEFNSVGAIKEEVQEIDTSPCTCADSSELGLLNIKEEEDSMESSNAGYAPIRTLGIILLRLVHSIYNNIIYIHMQVFFLSFFFLPRSNYADETSVVGPSLNCQIPHHSGFNGARKRKRTESFRADNSVVLMELADLREEFVSIKKRLEENEAKDNTDDVHVDTFFQSCASRLKRLPKDSQSILQYQIDLLFHNAENPNLQIPLPVIHERTANPS
ncbi:hypothetical protein CAPTEDRAFT_228679 [Capitella teleta]|uniref:MADF domain-containing protein n=1 Tax=Capitella teleta TaxID=283909 RepID=R7U814_CAPTE|nr:hypothetical protein CAPTEDRAFT_228679 [Capitella teleta]|eukprot:ELT99791.1 hypothetical protein CAPTEDRAFT_228679 [Capitella teleta]